MLINIYNRIFRKKDIELQEEKFKLLKEAETDFYNRYFIHRIIENASFTFEGKRKDNALNLMEKGYLQGRDTETTTFLAPLFDEANLVRGSIKLWEKEPYPHDWLEINISGLVYCFDPCFNGLCLKSDYYKIFKPTIKAKLPSEMIKRELLRYLHSDNKALIYGKDDINSPFYKIFASTSIQVEDDKIKRLDVKFYDK